MILVGWNSRIKNWITSQVYFKGICDDNLVEGESLRRDVNDNAVL